MEIAHGMSATLEAVVVRKDGTVETFEGDITHLDEAFIKQVLREREGRVAE